jgi:hypothetical protein
MLETKYDDAKRLKDTSSGTKAEVANFSSSNYTFNEIPRYIKCSDEGTLIVDFYDSGTQIPLPVTKGVNPERITTIYSIASGSSNITVVGIS